MSEKRIILGLYTGRAADGVDAAIVEIEGKGAGMHLQQAHSLHRFYPELLRQRIEHLAAGAESTALGLSRLDEEIISCVTETSKQLLKRANLRPENLTAVGYSGQVIHPSGPVLGSIAALAGRLRVPVAGQFVLSDLSTGGNGAGPSGWADWLMFRHEELARVVLHLGGVAELVFLPQLPAPADVVAFDAGPGTALIDLFMWKFNHRHFDADGAVAAAGRFNPALLNELQTHRWYQQSEPKRVDLGEFGENWVWRVLQMAEKHNCHGPDLIATITELVAWNLARDVMTLTQRPHEVVLAGGGAMNIHLAGRLRKLLAPSKTYTSEKYGFGLRAERAVAQAALAAARLDGVPANCATTSGAWEPTCLGLLASP